MPADPLPLSERIHQACPCADMEQGYGSCDIGCKCDTALQHPEVPPSECLWQGHSLAGEADTDRAFYILTVQQRDAAWKEVEALTAKVETSHAPRCICKRPPEGAGFYTDPDDFVDPRCTAWRSNV